MTDAQVGILVGAVITAGGGIATLIRWVVVQWRGERAADREERKASEDAQRDERKASEDAQREERTLDRAERREDRAVLGKVSRLMSILLERERVRYEGRGREPSKAPPTLDEQWPENESSDVFSMMERKTEQASAELALERASQRQRINTPGKGGVRVARPGTHHDKGG